MIPRKTRNAFARCSSGPTYYDTKGAAVRAFDSALAPMELAPLGTSTLHHDNGRSLIDVLSGGEVVGRAFVTWHRMESGRWEFVGYIA